MDDLNPEETIGEELADRRDDLSPLNLDFFIISILNLIISSQLGMADFTELPTR